MNANMSEIAANFNKMFNNEDEKRKLFVSAKEEEIEKLKSLIDCESKVIDFYESYQPNELPMLDCYVNLLDIDRILVENADGEPGKYLAQFGVYVFAVTAGGNVVCIDTNNMVDGDPSVLIADANFCSFNDELQCVEIDIMPDDVMEDDEDILILNYENIKKCLYEIENSFYKFMLKLSLNEYEDLEEFLED